MFLDTLLSKSARSTQMTAWLVAFAFVTLSCATTSAQEQEISSRTGQEKAYIEGSAEVTIVLAFRGEELRRVFADPETAVIFVNPDDRRLVSEVTWRVECRMDGKVISCPDLLAKTVIEAKQGCSPDIFGQEVFAIPGDRNAIDSGEANLDVYKRLYREYQSQRKAMMEKDRSMGSSLLGCRGDEIKQAPETVDMENGLAWQYNVTVVLEDGKEFVLDPEIWVEKDEDP